MDTTAARRWLRVALATAALATCCAACDDAATTGDGAIPDTVTAADLEGDAQDAADSGMHDVEPDTATDTAPELDAEPRDTVEPQDDDAILDLTADVADVPLPTVEWTTSRDDAGRLVVHAPAPALAAACEPCLDADHDGLVDAFEDGLLAVLRPCLRLDEDERLLDDETAVVHDVARVFAVSTEPLRLRALIMIGYSRDYGSCGLTAHNGDSERVAIELLATGPASDGALELVAQRFYTAAHEGTVNDHSQRFDATDPTLVFAQEAHGPRWVVFPSANKHATYASIASCEAIANGIPCLDEDCGADGVADPATYELLPGVVNAGEPSAPRLTDLAPIGFPGDDAWAEQDFCGGRGGSGCSAPVRRKLLDDPFAP